MGDERVRESYAVFLVEGKPTNIVGVASPKLLFLIVFSRVWVFPDTANEKKRKSLADTLRNGRHGRGHAEKYKTSSGNTKCNVYIQ